MKQIIIIAIVAIVAIFLLHNFFGQRYNFDSKPYEAKIDSLKKEIDSILNKNDSLVDSERKLVQSNQVLENGVAKLKNSIAAIKKDSSKIKKVDSYTATEVDSFFLNRYLKEYQEHSKDSTRLPIQVAKAAVVDVLELDKTKSVLEKTDSLVSKQDSLIGGKNEIISVLKNKEINYQSVINLQAKQQEDYNSQILGLNQELKKSNRSIRNQKIKTFLLGAAVIVLAITHK